MITHITAGFMKVILLLKNSMTQSSSFYVQLPSNSSVYGNKPCEFLTRLAKKLSFNSEWSVGLAVISYPHSWPSIGTSDAQFIEIYWRYPKYILEEKFNEFYVQKLLPSSTRIEVPRSKHFNAERLEDALLNLIRDAGKKLSLDLDAKIIKCIEGRIRPSLSKDDPVNVVFENIIKEARRLSNLLKNLRYHLKFEYIKEFQRFKISYSSLFESKNIENIEDVPDDDCIIGVNISQQLAYVVGLESTKLPASGNYASFSPDMLGGISSLYVYAPGLIESVIIGDTTAPLLRIVHVKGMPDDNVEDIYAAVQYHKLLVKELSEIKIEIRTATGRLIPFEYGNCILTLHFRKLPYY